MFILKIMQNTGINYVGRIRRY